MTIGVIIQARMGSTRLPGKVLRLIGDRPLIAHVIGRAARLRSSARIVVATSVETRDDVVEAWCHTHGISCFRGSETNVLDRYWQCAQSYGFDHVVRLTADNPFMDVDELDRLITFHLEGGYDYSHSFGQLPLGVGAEIFSRNALEKSHIESSQPNHFEHVNEYIEEHPELFLIGRLEVPAAKLSPKLRLTVDTEQDWQLACKLAVQSAPGDLETEEAIRLCSQSA